MRALSLSISTTIPPLQQKEEALTKSHVFKAQTPINQQGGQPISTKELWMEKQSAPCAHSGQ